MGRVDPAERALPGHNVDPIPSRRRYPRFPVQLDSSVRFGEQSASARVSDISAGGAQFQCAGHPFEPGQIVDLSIDQIGYITATVVWRTQNRFGVSFEESPMGVGVRLRAAKIA